MEFLTFRKGWLEESTKFAKIGIIGTLVGMSEIAWKQDQNSKIVVEILASKSKWGF